MRNFDVLVLGAGAAGMFSAIEAGKRGRRVLVVDHARAPGEKIRISGGGRCNFTNVNTRPDRFISANPKFAVSALARYTPQRFIELVKSYGIAFHEKTLGQLFCDGSSLEIINLLTDEMRRAGAALELTTSIEAVDKAESGFRVRLSSGEISCQSLVVATGGKSIPKMGATGLGYKLAEQFGLQLTEVRPALVPLTFEPRMLERLAPLSGIAIDATVAARGKIFREAMLFTHRGLSGPSILQVSSYWREGDAITINLLPDIEVGKHLRAARQNSPKAELQTVLSELMPRRLARTMVDEIGLTGMIGDLSDKKIDAASALLAAWTIKPTGSEGYRTAEVTLGGVDTKALNSTAMEARDVPGLYFIGEVVDVTGWLGGYNFQWAWASGWAAGQVA